MSLVGRDKNGRFIKGHKRPSEWNTEKQKSAAIKNLGDWIGRIPPMTDKQHTPETKKIMSLSAIGKHCGKDNGKYIEDRTKLVKKQMRNDYAYKDWAMNVKKRDGWKCKINNLNCSGKVIAHHILPWIDYPEERYNINNGITLCQTHHPRRRVEEKRLAPFFMELMSVSN